MHPGTGTVDFASMFRMIEGAGYRGPYTCGWGTLEQMLEGLDERSADVVRRRYGLLDGRQAKLGDIGKVWGITAERVRQIERAALANMRSSALVAA